MKFILSILIFLTTGSFCSQTVVLNDPFVLEPDAAVSDLYDRINASLSFKTASSGISIIFGNKLILNFLNDRRTIKDIGMDSMLNDIQIIQKPDFAALLEMVVSVNNIQNIPWLVGAMKCLSAASANQYQCRNLSKLGKGLDCDTNNTLIGVDLSHLNLTGMIHLESLPPTVRSLDLSFNDLETANLDGLRGKSLKRLNVEHNTRFHINTECFHSHNLNLRELQLSSNQIFPWISDLNEKRVRIQNWLCRVSRHRNVNYLELVIMDGFSMHFTPFHIKMLRVLEGVTNKEIIHDWVWKSWRVDYKRGRGGHPPRYRFDLSGLGLVGEIRLTYLPRSIRKLDLSNNHLSRISLSGEGQNCLEDLNLQNNPNVRVNLTEIDESSLFRHFCRLSISSNQLDIPGVLDSEGIIEYVRNWLSTSKMTKIVVDDVRLRKISIPSSRHYDEQYAFTIFTELLNQIK